MAFDRLSARAAAYKMHSRRDGREATAPARKAFLDRFEREVDPDRVLDPVERTRRASYARKAYFLNLAAKSAKVRRERTQV